MRSSGAGVHVFPYGKAPADESLRETIRSIVREELAAAQAARDKLPVSGWAAENLERAKAAGITDGARPQGWCTRQEAALMILSQRETK